MSLFVLIPGFGEPHWDNKLVILENNLKVITSYKWTNIKVRICQYTLTKVIPDSLIKKYPFVEVIIKEGIVGHFIKEFADPYNMACWDYIMLLLDDIELLDIDFDKMLKYQRDFSLDALSPCLSVDSKYTWKYMVTTDDQVCIKLANVCELFCMLFTFKAYKDYYIHVDINNPWVWGLDLIIKRYIGLNVGLMNKMRMKHWYIKESYNSRKDYDPIEGFQNCIAKYGETYQSITSQTPFTYYIIGG